LVTKILLAIGTASFFVFLKTLKEQVLSRLKTMNFGTKEHDGRILGISIGSNLHNLLPAFQIYHSWWKLMVTLPCQYLILVANSWYQMARFFNPQGLDNPQFRVKDWNGYRPGGGHGHWPRLTPSVRMNGRPGPVSTNGETPSLEYHS